MRNRSKRFFGHVSTAPKNYRLAVAHRTDFRTSEQTLQKFFIDGLTIAWSKGADMRLKAYTGQLQSTNLRPENQAPSKKAKLAN